MNNMADGKLVPRDARAGFGRKDFLKGAAATLAASMVRLSDAGECAGCDFVALQREMDAVPGEEFRNFSLAGPSMVDAERDAMYAKRPILRRYDDAFAKAVREAKDTVVADANRPAVWYVYNMGVLVKTPKAFFSIDLCHRLAPTIADDLDFAVITHNHLDHYTEAFYQAMNSRRKTVIQNFRDNYGACLHVKGGVGGFSRGECRYELNGVAVRTYETDHNHLLRGFVMPVEVHVGDYVILHVGDTFNTGDLRPERTPDLFIHHAWCWGDSNQTSDGINAFQPKCAVIAHHCELGHNKKPNVGGGVPLAMAYKRKAETEAAGVRAVAPFWGDRIA